VEGAVSLARKATFDAGAGWLFTEKARSITALNITVNTTHAATKAYNFRVRRADGSKVNA
jgi:hypothetical protein